MIKPVFVPKAEQDTIAECEILEAEEEALEEAMKKRLDERKVKTKHILVEEIRKDKEIQKNLEAEVNGGEIDTYDEINEAEEYEAWKAREIARIKRDRDNREAMLKEEIENVSNMTEEERREWERKNPKPLQKWKFMQKHFHKGAFLRTPADDHASTAGGDDNFKRDFSYRRG